MSLGIQAFELKKNVAVKYLTVPLSKNDRKRWIENWVDKNSSQTLGIDENDLWQCAQARERNLVLVTIDGRIEELLRRTRFCSFWLLNSAFISSVPQQPSSQFSFALRPRSSWLVLLPRLAQIECGPSWGRFPRSPPSLPAPPLERLVFHPVGSDKPDPLGKAERAAIFVVVATDGRATIEAVKAGARRGVLGDRFFRKRSVVARL